MVKKALIVWGGWEGHQPEQVARVFEQALIAEGFEVEVHNTLDAFRAADRLLSFSVIVPVWTMGTIVLEQLIPLINAVRSGVGIAGCHGGMCDAFRTQTEYHFMTGGQWVAHPGNDGVRYRVVITDRDHEITKGIDDFDVVTEQYYMHVDPGIQVLAATDFPVADGPHVQNGPVKMPVVWTKFYGQGRVFYCSLGHQAEIVSMPPVLELCTRGILWAARVSEDARVPSA